MCYLSNNQVNYLIYSGCTFLYNRFGTVWTHEWFRVNIQMVHWARSGQTKKNPAPLLVLLSRRLFDLKRKLSNRFVKKRYEKSSYVTNRNVWNSYWTQVKKEVYCRVGDAVQGRYNDGEPGWDNVGIRLVPSLGIGRYWYCWHSNCNFAGTCTRFCTRLVDLSFANSSCWG